MARTERDRDSFFGNRLTEERFRIRRTQGTRQTVGQLLGMLSIVMSTRVHGSCLCGGIRFEVELPFIQASHCHCDRCRKHSGTAVCTQARVWRTQFRLLQGEELIKVYGKGEGAVKAFCMKCGSSVFGGDWPEGEQISIRMGAFDDDPGIRPQFHTFVANRAAWDVITDDLPQYAERRV